MHLDHRRHDQGLLDGGHAGHELHDLPGEIDNDDPWELHLGQRCHRHLVDDGHVNHRLQLWYEVAAVYGTKWTSAKSAAAGETTISSTGCRQPEISALQDTLSARRR